MDNVELNMGLDGKGRVYFRGKRPHTMHLATEITFVNEKIPEVIPVIEDNPPAAPEGFYEEELQKPEFNIEDYI